MVSRSYSNNDNLEAILLFQVTPLVMKIYKQQNGFK